MLQYTNAQRTLAGVPMVRLGSNPAAQLHAEAALDNCYTGHWDKWGLKPNHRYTLTGGAGTGAENVYGLAYCHSAFNGRETNYGNLTKYAKRAHSAWMRSPGHRKAILDPRHTILNIGIAHNDFNEYFVQQFTSDYIDYDDPPNITPNGYLSIKGSIQDATLANYRVLPYQLTHEPPPQTLSPSQIAHTYALCLPKVIAFISHHDTYQPTIPFTEPHYTCANPYNNNPDREAPATPQAAHNAFTTAKDNYLGQANPPITQNLPVLAPTESSNKPNSFQSKTDIRNLLNQYGPGIYTVRLWGYTNINPKQAVVLSEQSIFWETSPPNGHPYHPNP